MNTIWNKVNLEHPPNSTWRISAQKFDVKPFLITIEKVIRELQAMHVLHIEAALLSRLIYRMKSKFRNDKGLKNMEKVNRALINYLTMTLEKEYTDLKHYVEHEDKVIVLPSRQMLEYVLVRTQGFAKLMARVEKVARCSAHFFKTRIMLGHAWTISLTVYAVVSRIWLLSRYLIQKSCKWYNGLYQYLKIFPVIGLSWLSENQSLPCDLKSWLSLEWINEKIPCISSNKNWQDTMFKLLKTQTIDSDDDLIDIKNEISLIKLDNFTNDASRNDIPICDVLNKELAPNSDVNDIGEAMNRRTFKASLPKIYNVGIPSIRKRKYIQTDSNAKMEQLEEYKSNESKKQKKYKVITFNTVSQNIELQNAKITSKIKNRKKRFNDNVEFDQDILTLDSITKKSELITLLNRDFYPHMDKLYWNMVRNKAKKYLIELKKCYDNTEEAAVLEKAIRHLRNWIH